MNDSSDEKLSVHRDNINHQLKILETLEETAHDATKTVTLDQSMVGRLSRMDALQGQAMAKATGHRRQLKLVQLRNALKRIDEGSFGKCIECLEYIDPRRVAHNPAVALCLRCAAALEDT
ncbi:MAG: DnaK suppressor protein [Granulosicoccus sp.]|jgi:DnaK suppressor protein